MKALFNGQIIDDKLSLPFNDRAFQFGDGIFETIIASNGTAQLLSYHFARLEKGASSLGLNIEKKETLTDYIETALKVNQLDRHARIKLQVWRKPNSSPGYSPSTSEANVLVTAFPYEPNKTQVKENVAFSEDVSLHYSKYSRFKTTNSLAYIYASLERDTKKVDDLILMDRQGHVSECISSNLFWVKGDNYYSPSLRSGCVEGVMRNFVIDQLEERGVKFETVMATKHDLLTADTVFSTNVAGICPIRSIDGHDFSPTLNLPF